MAWRRLVRVFGRKYSNTLIIRKMRKILYVLCVLSSVFLSVNCSSKDNRDKD